jgi:hypothetical protein
VRGSVSPSAEIKEQIDRLLAAGVGENPRESLSELARLGARLITFGRAEPLRLTRSNSATRVRSDVAGAVQSSGACPRASAGRRTSTSGRHVVPTVGPEALDPESGIEHWLEGVDHSARLTLILLGSGPVTDTSQPHARRGSTFPRALVAPGAFGEPVVRQCCGRRVEDPTPRTRRG